MNYYKNASIYIMPDREFRRLGGFIYDETGIKMPSTRRGDASVKTPGKAPEKAAVP
ncbi:hypothetical protein M1N52_01570 [Thermodesulfovibrionales bacterium]|nr:hypothetical protein [Thermodesulfovibrionales bacterium]MCL0074897.1 hypothetical protein [Thermodesulfovibrionales bacterium]MCL0085948.1 hypothetical protein [Thermodesulfovibrionales bacterium]